MKLDEASRNWTELGEDDPLWVVLTDPDKKGHRWTEDDFFATGRAAIDDIFARLARLNVSVAAARAFDFGCGVGRLSQALAARFQSVDGVDISSSMLAHAARFNRFPGRVKYHLNVQPHLAAFPSGQYDFLCSLIALQHTPRRFQRCYIADFARLLKPGGVAHFQTVHTVGWRRCVPDWFADFIRKRQSHGRAFIPLYGLPLKEVRAILATANCAVVQCESSGYGGWESRYVTDLFTVRKNT